MRRYFFAALAIAALSVVHAAAEEVSGPARVKDADTLEVAGKTFRLHGIDAPEFDQPCLGGGGALYPCGVFAAQELTKFIAGRDVRCEDIGPDPVHPKRRIGRCSVDGIDLHHWLVQQGWAVNFEPYAKGEFLADEEEAKRGHFGMWKGCFVAPRDFRRWNKRTAKLLGWQCSPDAREKLYPDVADMPTGCEIKGHYTVRDALRGHLSFAWLPQLPTHESQALVLLRGRCHRGAVPQGVHMRLALERRTSPWTGLRSTCPGLKSRRLMRRRGSSLSSLIC